MSRLRLLVDLTNGIQQQIDLDALIGRTAERIAEALEAERATVWLIDAEQQVLVSRVATLPEAACLRQPIGRGVVGYVAATGESVRVDDASSEARFDPSSDKATGYITKRILAVPIREKTRGPVRGVLQVLNRRDHAFDDEDERYACALAGQLCELLELTTLRAGERHRPGLRLRGPYNGIIGQGAAMQAVYERLVPAADTDASVLLRGETGTGKTLLARAIHVNSPRIAGNFVTVDCMALPATLIESELFGHEQGAFTGAVRRTTGRVEAAHGGTLFLDEVGDLPLEVQGKLLRLLQDRCFERVGGRDTHAIDMRIVAATHQDLERLMSEGRFRQDLYYRLRVVEVVVPSLRERGRDEIVALAEHFACKYANRYRRPKPVFEADAMAILMTHRWPGNVRELEHWVESAVVLASDGHIAGAMFPRISPLPMAAPPGSDLARASSGSATPSTSLPQPLVPGLTLEEVVRRYARQTLERAEGRRSRAAKLLGISRNRLARILDE